MITRYTSALPLTQATLFKQSCSLSLSKLSTSPLPHSFLFGVGPLGFSWTLVIALSPCSLYSSLFPSPTLFLSALIAAFLTFSSQLVHCLPSSSPPWCITLFLLSSILCCSPWAPEVNTSKHWPTAQTTQSYWSGLVREVMGLLVGLQEGYDLQV